MIVFSLRLLMVGAIGLSLSAAHAELVPYRFEGQVTAAGALFPGKAVGDTFEGSFVLDTSAERTDFPDIGASSYNGSTMDFSVEGVSYDVERIDVYADSTKTAEGIQLVFDFPVGTGNLSLRSSADIFADTSVPQNLDLLWFDSLKSLKVTVLEPPQIENQGTITSLTANAVPVVDAGGPYFVNEGGSVNIAAVASDSNGDPLTYQWSINTATCSIADPTSAATSVTCPDGNERFLLTVEVSDGLSQASDSDDLDVVNVAPDITITSPVDGAMIPVTQSLQVSATLSDAGASDTHTCGIDFGDGTILNSQPCDTTNGFTPSAHTYAQAGVYEIWVSAYDSDGGGRMVSFLVVVYDPAAGFVTGHGWIQSQAGAYTPDPSLTGKAHFGFVSKYQKGATTPTGNTQFMFRAADLNFHSTSYDWLVVAGGTSRFKGEGTVNGLGNYGFMVSATDGDATSAPGDDDSMRMKIWDKDAGDAVIYDNGVEQGLGGGNIHIQAGGKP